MNIEKAKQYYISTAIIVFNFLVLVVVLNLTVAAAFFIRSLFLATNPVTEKYDETRLSIVYPGKDPQQINALLAETWSRSHVYEPFTQYKERPYRGHYVNVDEHGFRLSANQGSWPPDPSAFNIFVFGGSSTFGYGVSDDETIPSSLQKEIRANTGTVAAVYNFGRGDYYSTQERVLFESLLAAGNRPTVAIFIDGLNDFDHEHPVYTERLQNFMASSSLESTGLEDEMRNLVSLVERLPVIHLLRRIERRACGWLNDCAVPSAAGSKSAAFILDRYMANKKMIEAVATAYGVVPVFVWQPVPHYKADQKSLLFRNGPDPHITAGYTMLATERQKKPIAGNFLWCADLQEDRHEPLYVDEEHYTAAFSKDIAACIAKQLRNAGIISAK